MYIAWLTWAALREENPVIIYISLLDLRYVDGLCLHINLSLLLAITKYQTCQSANHCDCKAESELRKVIAVLHVLWRPAEVQKVPCWKCPDMQWNELRADCNNEHWQFNGCYEWCNQLYCDGCNTQACKANTTNTYIWINPCTKACLMHGEYRGEYRALVSYADAIPMLL